MGNINPCEKCDHHLAGKGKSGRRCMNCGKREKYVAAHGGMFASMPDELCDYRRFVIAGLGRKEAACV